MNQKAPTPSKLTLFVAGPEELLDSMKYSMMGVKLEVDGQLDKLRP